ncbi:MAG: GIY-YIG nuclease family protein [Selenomonadaceae bacterium]|nr:GIY-YIG nuclease family protein [Selenomonadaceae bacterium]
MEDEKIYGRIYGIECLINHKIYVGQTTRSVEKRISEHKCAKTAL